MKKITREVCLHFIKIFYKSRILYLVLVSVFAVLVLWSLTKNTVIVICGAVIALLYLAWRIRELGVRKSKTFPRTNVIWLKMRSFTLEKDFV